MDDVQAAQPADCLQCREAAPAFTASILGRLGATAEQLDGERASVHVELE
jgi:hypothetical protein